MKLHNIEAAVRKQFVWLASPLTNWQVDPAFTLGVKWMGATVFVGLAVQMGFEMEEIKDYMHLDEQDMEEKLLVRFQERMHEMLERRISGNDLDKDDVTQLLSTKAGLAVSYLRLHHMKEFIPSNSFNY